MSGPTRLLCVQAEAFSLLATPLHALLEHLGTQRIFLTGVTLEQCILMAAAEAYLRDLDIVVVRDCITGLRQREESQRYIERILHGKAITSSGVRFNLQSKRRTERESA